MKTNYLKGFRGLLAAGVLSVALMACEKDVSNNGNGDEVYATTAQANGQQTTPPSGSSATATLVGEFNARTNNWEYRINWTGMTSAVTAVQVHGPADIGTSGQMQLALAITVPGVTGSAQGNVMISEDLQAHLLANKLYFTLLTATHVNGEVRGQIIATRVQ